MSYVFDHSCRKPEMLQILGVRVPVVKSLPPEKVRYALPGMDRSIIYEFKRYESWADAVRETGRTLAKIRWDITKALGRAK